MRLISRLEYFQTLILSSLYHRLSDTLNKQKGKVGSNCMDWTEIYIIIGMFFYLICMKYHLTRLRY